MNEVPGADRSSHVFLSMDYDCWPPFKKKYGRFRVCFKLTWNYEEMPVAPSVPRPPRCLTGFLLQQRVALGGRVCLPDEWLTVFDFLLHGGRDGRGLRPHLHCSVEPLNGLNLSFLVCKVGVMKPPVAKVSITFEGTGENIPSTEPVFHTRLRKLPGTRALCGPQHTTCRTP